MADRDAVQVASGACVVGESVGDVAAGWRVHVSMGPHLGGREEPRKADVVVVRMVTRIKRKRRGGIWGGRG